MWRSYTLSMHWTSFLLNQLQKLMLRGLLPVHWWSERMLMCLLSVLESGKIPTSPYVWTWCPNWLQKKRISGLNLVFVKGVSYAVIQQALYWGVTKEVKQYLNCALRDVKQYKNRFGKWLPSAVNQYFLTDHKTPEVWKEFLRVRNLSGLFSPSLQLCGVLLHKPNSSIFVGDKPTGYDLPATKQQTDKISS